MKNNKKITAIFLILTLTLATCLTGCGGDGAEPTATPDAYADIPRTSGINMTKSAPQTWDAFTIYLPAELDFTGGSEEDPFDVRYFTLSIDYSHYFAFHVEDEKSIITAEYDEYKSTYTNEQIEVDETYGDIDWEGFQFLNSDGEPCFVVTTRKHKKSVLVRSNGYTFDDPTVRDIFEKLDIEKRNESTLPDPARYDVINE